MKENALVFANCVENAVKHAGRLNVVWNNDGELFKAKKIIQDKIATGKDISANYFKRVSLKEELNLLTGQPFYLSALPTDKDFLDGIIDYVFNNDVNFLVRTSSTLEEVGLFDTKFALSPIMLLSKTGLLEKATIVGGAYLDKEDISLLAQENITVILTPSFDAGYGFGIPPLSSLYDKGVKVKVGTADGKYNSKCSVDYEADMLKLFTNAVMKRENALPDSYYNKITRT